MLARYSVFSHAFCGLHTLHGSMMGEHGVQLTSDCRFWYSKASYLFLNLCVSMCLCTRAHLCLGLVNTPKSTENANSDSNVSNKLAVTSPDMQDFGPKHISPHLSTFHHLSKRIFHFMHLLIFCLRCWCLSGLPLFWKQ